jgi:hypothetical protein
VKTYSAASWAGNKTREDTMAVGTGVTRVIEIGLDDGVVLWEKLKDDLIACLRVDGIRRESETVFADCHGLSGRGGAFRTSRVDD